MSRIENGVLEIEQEDFFTVFGTPLYPGELVGRPDSEKVFSPYRYIKLGDDYWVLYDYIAGTREKMIEEANKLNSDLALSAKFQNPRFIAGTFYYFSANTGGMRRLDSNNMGYGIWINRLPQFDPGNVVVPERIYV